MPQNLGQDVANLDANRALIRANRVITVCKDGNGDFLHVKDAIGAIGVDPRYPASSTDNRYTILQMPSSDGTDSIFHEQNPILWNKDYVQWVVWGGHDAVKTIMDVNDDGVVVSGASCEFICVNIRRTAASATGKAAFKTTGAADDTVFRYCKSNNFDIGWLNTVGTNKVQNCAITLGIGSCMIEVTGGTVFCINCQCSATINNAVTVALGYTVYVTGASAVLRLDNFYDTSTAGGGTKIGCCYVTASGTLVSRTGYHANGTNGIHNNGGTVNLVSTLVTACTNNIHAANAAGIIIMATVSLTSAGTWHILQDGMLCMIQATSTQMDDVSKVSLPAGCTCIRINEVQERDTIPYITGSWNLISEMSLQLSAQSVVGATTRDMTNLDYRMIFIKVTTQNHAGTLHLAAIAGGGTAGSYNPQTGALTAGDTEDIVINGTGWYVSTKRWYSTGAGVVRLSVGAGGLDIIVDGYRVGRAEQNVSYMLRMAKFVTNGTGGGAVFQVVIEKWSQAAGVVTVWDSNAVLGNSVPNGQQITFMRDAINTPFNVNAISALQAGLNTPEFMIIRFVGLSNLSPIRMILDQELSGY